MEPVICGISIAPGSVCCIQRGASCDQVCGPCSRSVWVLSVADYSDNLSSLFCLSVLQVKLMLKRAEEIKVQLEVSVLNSFLALLLPLPLPLLLPFPLLPSPPLPLPSPSLPSPLSHVLWDTWSACLVVLVWCDVTVHGYVFDAMKIMACGCVLKAVC